MELITSEERFWRDCRCATLVVRYLHELLGPTATRWQFGRAIIRDRHVSTMFFRPTLSGEDALEIWVSAKLDETDSWLFQHTELPEPLSP